MFFNSTITDLKTFLLFREPDILPQEAIKICLKAKRTKSVNRMQITEFPARLSQHTEACSEGHTGNVGETQLT